MSKYVTPIEEQKRKDICDILSEVNCTPASITGHAYEYDRFGIGILDNEDYHEERCGFLLLNKRKRRKFLGEIKYWTKDKDIEIYDYWGSHDKIQKIAENLEKRGWEITIYKKSPAELLPDEYYESFMDDYVGFG